MTRTANNPPILNGAGPCDVVERPGFGLRCRTCQERWLGFETERIECPMGNTVSYALGNANKAFADLGRTIAAEFKKDLARLRRLIKY